MRSAYLARLDRSRTRVVKNFGLGWVSSLLLHEYMIKLIIGQQQI